MTGILPDNILNRKPTPPRTPEERAAERTSAEVEATFDAGLRAAMEAHRLAEERWLDQVYTDFLDQHYQGYFVDGDVKGLSASTLTKYKRFIAKFKKFAAELSTHTGFQVSHCPASVGLVGLWLHNLRVEHGAGPSDLAIARAAIGYAHQCAGHWDPTGDPIHGWIVRAASIDKKKANGGLNGHIETEELSHVETEAHA
ncbi:MAG: hypothetical protein ACR2GC_10560 [Methyloceanibacter sp.]|uniref:hypothetical protein n=1 Tax=Methyloceanibacter sp. TaxID=1965321 RepID=UPI003D9B6ECE